ncbi:hypothetical protein IC617_07640 [Neiella sp. HB171785]|uniref:Uncharacterized protein n=1 Tax=Neiella litorisoli TaxID=2771431 RepID=A0A8J6QUP1_9GAMM|nr:hypothetical protein [Neiella litorisoli]MBD1389293.1 hypothetical protein [Neiella litorisoli]
MFNGEFSYFFEKFGGDENGASVDEFLYRTPALMMEIGDSIQTPESIVEFAPDLVLKLSEVSAQVACFEGALAMATDRTGGFGGLGQGLRGAIDSVELFIKNRIKPLILKISSQLWQAIKAFMQPKGWSLGAGIKGDPLGLVDANLQIHFGS